MCVCPIWLSAELLPAEAEATEAEASSKAAGALDKANILAEAEANATKAEIAQDLKLAQAIALIVANAAALTENQRAMLASVLASTEVAEATEA